MGTRIFFTESIDTQIGRCCLKWTLPIILICSAMLSGCIGTDSKQTSVCRLGATPDSTLYDISSTMEITAVLPINGEAPILSVRDVAMAGDGVYVLDDKRQSILYVGNNGNSRVVVSNRGRGHGEYLSLDAFEVSSQGVLFVLDSDAKKVHTYTANGKFINTIDACSGSDIALAGDTIAVNCNGFEDENIIMMGTDGSGRKSFTVKAPGADANIGNGCVSAMHGRFHMTRPLDYTIYQLHNEELQPCITLDLGEQNIPDALLAQQDAFRLHTNLLAFDGVLFIRNFTFFGDRLFVCTNNGEKYVFDLNKRRTSCLTKMSMPYLVLFSGDMFVATDGRFVAFVSDANMRALRTFYQQQGNTPGYLDGMMTSSIETSNELWVVKGNFTGS